jgi:hypothetical protein
MLQSLSLLVDFCVEYPGSRWTCSLWADGVRTELNFRTSNWCLLEIWCQNCNTELPSSMQVQEECYYFFLISNSLAFQI